MSVGELCVIECAACEFAAPQITVRELRTGKVARVKGTVSKVSRVKFGISKLALFKSFAYGDQPLELIVVVFGVDQVVSDGLINYSGAVSGTKVADHFVSGCIPSPAGELLVKALNLREVMRLMLPMGCRRSRNGESQAISR